MASGFFFSTFTSICIFTIATSMKDAVFFRCFILPYTFHCQLITHGNSIFIRCSRRGGTYFYSLLFSVQMGLYTTVMIFTILGIRQPRKTACAAFNDNRTSPLIRITLAQCQTLEDDRLTFELHHLFNGYNTIIT